MKVILNMENLSENEKKLDFLVGEKEDMVVTDLNSTIGIVLSPYTKIKHFNTIPIFPFLIQT
jgi:hypothetical protein